MRPVTLVKLPNQPGFLGTFDTTNLTSWWKSEPMPAGVLEIIDNEWAYGQYHVAIAKMVDGTYSILQSGDYGKSWYVRFNTSAHLLTVTRIDYGWLLVSASDGWYVSYDSGTTWAKISAQAPNCQTVVTMGDDVLFAHDCSHIWKSVNKGVNWAQVLNCHDIIHDSYHGGTSRTTWTGTVYPALAAANGVLVAGCGPYLVVSSNLGVSWTMPWPWFWDPRTLIPWLVPHANRRILQIVHTDTTGTGADNVTFIIRVWMIPEGVVRHVLSTNAWKFFSARFDRPFLGADVGNLEAYDVLRPGETFHDKIVVSAQSVYNTRRGVFEPAISYSKDGGYNWIDVDVSRVKVYEGDPDESGYVFGGPFLEDDCTLWTWSGCPCHNSGNWRTSRTLFERGISWEMDFKTQGYRDKEYLGGMRLIRIGNAGWSHDALLLNAVDIGKPFDSLIMADVPKNLLADSLIKKAFDSEPNHDMALVLRYTIPLLHDALFSKALPCSFNVQAYLRGEVNSGYGMGLVLTRSRFNELLIKLERFFPQIYDIRAPMLQYPVYDSRKDGTPSDN